MKFMRVHAHAFDLLYSKWSCQIQSLDRTKSKCLCELTSCIGCWSITTLGWLGLLRFLEKHDGFRFRRVECHEPISSPLMYFR